MVRSILSSAVMVAVACPAFATDVSEGEKLFALAVRPIFREKCIACHGADGDELQGGFDLRTRAAMAAGGESFGHDVLKPGDGDGSILYRVVARTEEWYEMPPKEAEALTEEQAWAIRDWIDACAPWPDESRVAAIVEEYSRGVTVPTSGGQSDAWTDRRYEPEDLWGWRPLDVTEPPAGTHPVDHFIDDRLEGVGLWPAPAADGRTVARRMAFGLTGLPPEPCRVDRFAAHYEADAEGAVAEYADELLASRHYGEHFGRLWLDVARYADTAGFANDFARPNTWRYRDYVIRSFNRDKPFDEFAREKLAGDEIAPDNPEARIATGFLRTGPWEHTSMSVFRETRQQWLDDVVDSVGQSSSGSRCSARSVTTTSSTRSRPATITRCMPSSRRRSSRRSILLSSTKNGSAPSTSRND